MTTDPPDGGFVLPAVVIALSLLYLTAGVGYTLSTLETRMAEAHGASVRAFYLADGAMRDALAVFGDSVSSRSYAFGEGSAAVEVSRLVDTSTGVRLVRFTATARVAMRRGGASARRVETVVLMAELDPASAAPVAVPGAWREIIDW